MAVFTIAQRIQVASFQPKHDRPVVRWILLAMVVASLATLVIRGS